MAKVLFIQDILYEYFGVMYMSGYLKKHGHECDVIIEHVDREWMKKLEEHDPDIVAFSVLTGSYKWAVAKAYQIKKKFNKPVLFGGVHVFLNPEKTIQNPFIDGICTGEGETAIKELCDAIDRNEPYDSVNGFWFRNPDGTIKKNPPAKLFDDLDSLPFADRSIYWKYKAIRNRTTLPLLGSRGCPYTCTYCFIPAAKKIFEGQGKFIRERSAENIIKEIELCYSLSQKKKIVHFVDDHFGNNRKLYLQVFQSLSTIGNGRLKWGGAIRVERFNKEEYVRELSKTNHAMLGIAVECGDENYRKEVLKRGVKNQEIIDAATLARKYKMRFTTLNMVGLPGETFEQAMKTLELNILIKPEYANCYIYQPYPGTELQKYALDHHFIDEKISEQLGISVYSRYWKNKPEFNRIINLQRVFGAIVSFPVLKRPLLFIAKNNFNLLADFIFGFYFMIWLTLYFNITIQQLISYFSVWMRSAFSEDNSPPEYSIREGEGQLYPSLSD